MFMRFGQRLINLDQVRSIKSDGAGSCRLEFADGETLGVSENLFDIEEKLAPVLPAPPGFSVIELYETKDRSGITSLTLPMVGFRAHKGRIEPVTIQGEVPEATIGYAIVLPDGRCEDPWDGLHESVETYKASIESTYLAHREGAARKAKA